MFFALLQEETKILMLLLHNVLDNYWNLLQTTGLVLRPQNEFQTKCNNMRIVLVTRLVNRRQNWESIIDVQIRSIIDKNQVSTCWKVTEWPRPLLRQIEFRAMQTLPESKMADGEKKQIVLPLPNLRELRWNDVLTALNSACNEEIRHISTRKHIFCIEYWLLFLWIDRKCRDLVKLLPTESEKTKLSKWSSHVYFN